MSATETASPMSGFLRAAQPSPAARSLYDEDVADLGYVMNASRLWAHQPAAVEALFELLGQVAHTGGLDKRLRGILVTACASTLGDSYCSLMWGGKLAEVTDAELAAGVLAGTDAGLTAAEHAAAGWARRVVQEPNATTIADVQTLRDTGFDDAQIFAMTTFVALRLAFSTVNDALGARPDAQVRATIPQPVLDVVTYGRPIEEQLG